MRLLTATLHNFCQHKDLTVAFAPGVNGIFGPNGCGKSNLLRVIYFAFAGESPNAGSKSDDIAHGADRGFVEVEFEVNGRVGVIRRQLRTAACNLKLGDERYTSATRVNEHLWPILGVTKDLLGRTIFVHQERRCLIQHPFRVTIPWTGRG